ncbi:hypothetical protein [Methylobacterium sp. R2-1]|uniref:hypothetical protein n=1 Tax=Methylobacterium sp. R2-1 TaxID=2587064 RepID=UPI00160DB136|nr:hypothetical protein [Methylobacterium sp. R2-1]MBB2965080.1 hypothetical protein [Methylobacterium sp. R2-1]
MTLRSILAAAAIAASFTASATAQEGRTFQGWGHTFNVPGSQVGLGRVAGSERDTYRDDRSDAPKRAYVSGNTGTVVESEGLATDTPSQVINVWGARIEVPAR